MSGFFGQIMQGMLGDGGRQGQTSPLVGILQQVLSMRDGDKEGVAAIISKFESSGLGQSVQSWVGTGENHPVSGDQIGQVFSPQQIDGWAQQAGTTADALRGVLAEALPHVVDRATPGGQVPEQTPDLSALFGQLLGGGGANRSGW